MSALGRHQSKGSRRTSDIPESRGGLESHVGIPPIHHLEAPPPVELAGIAQVGIPAAPTGRRRSSGALETPTSAGLGRSWVGQLSQQPLALQTDTGTGFDRSA